MNDFVQNIPFTNAPDGYIHITCDRNMLRSKVIFTLGNKDGITDTAIVPVTKLKEIAGMINKCLGEME